MTFSEKDLWWTILLSIVGALGTLAAFWEKLGSKVWAYLLWPIIKYIWAFLRMPFDLRRISSEVTEADGTSIKSLIEVNTKETMAIVHEVKLINRRSRAALAISPNATFEADASGKWVWANKALYRLFGATGDEIRDWKWLNFIDDSDKDRVEERFSAAIIRMEDIDITMVINRGGEKPDRVRVHAYVHVMKDDQDKSLGYFGILIREL